jgi:hypothetical protein
MRTNPIIVVLLAIAAPAAAQPQPRCEVRFVRAPDDVRHVIETWLAAEPRCTSTIDLRVIPTDSGYYLIAQRPDGRIHERLVPDTQSAGVLVASWAADDWTAPRSDAAPVGFDVEQQASATPAETAAVTAVSAPPQPSRRAAPRWLSVGAMFSTSDTDDGGARVELDLISRGGFTLGTALAWSETSMMVGGSNSIGELRSSDIGATAYGAYTLRSDRWELRGAVGAGLVYTDFDGEILSSSSPYDPWSMSSYTGSGGGLVGTASVVLTRRLGDSWGVHAGLHGHVITGEVIQGDTEDVERVDGHLFLFTGLRRKI